MPIIRNLDARIARNQASDREVARLSGMTIEEYDADVTAPDPRGDTMTMQWHDAKTDPPPLGELVILLKRGRPTRWAGGGAPRTLKLGWREQDEIAGPLGASWWIEMTGDDVSGVTHWLPMPALPEEAS